MGINSPGGRVNATSVVCRYSTVHPKSWLSPLFWTNTLEVLNLRPESATDLYLFWSTLLFSSPSLLPLAPISSVEMSSNPNPGRIFTYADFDLQALCRQASMLRQGVSCTCDPDQRPASGSFNWAIFISFEDRVRWVFRSPHPRTFMLMEMGIKLLASEAATLRYLRAHSDIPVPEVYDYW